jgi:predicted phosphodiesterase
MDKQSIVLIGDIHGAFMDVPYLCKRYNIKDSYLIQLGDFGVGFYRENAYKTIFKKLNKRLEKQNNHLFAFRGNHDDPKYFEQTNNPFGYSNITLLADYSEIELLNKKFLCIGGATSIDRTWEKRIEGKTWWRDEPVKRNTTFEFKTDYDWVLTHTRPLVASPVFETDRIKHWLEEDEMLKHDLRKEGSLLNEIWDLTKPKNWAYGHFHQPELYEYGGTKFRCLDINEFYMIYE